MILKKKCSKCRKLQIIDNFYLCKKRKSGIYSKCKSCCRKYYNSRYASKKAHVRRIQAKSLIKNQNGRKNALLKYFFGITLDQYNEILASQNGKCAICYKPPDKRRLCVDHDHKSGKIRGLLCHQCNHAIGLFYENKQVMKNAIGYLNAHN